MSYEMPHHRNNENDHSTMLEEYTKGNVIDVEDLSPEEKAQLARMNSKQKDGDGNTKNSESTTPRFCVIDENGQPFYTDNLKKAKEEKERVAQATNNDQLAA